MGSIEEMPHHNVAIVGAGPGGLGAAIVLSKIANLKVTIYEKATVLREVGAGISIGQNTWNVLELLGVANSLTSGHPTLTVLNMNGKTGEEVHRMEKDIHAKTPNGRMPIRTQRTKLQSALLQHLPKGGLQLGKQLINLQELDHGVRLTFADGSSTTADLVIGADGIRSVVRDSAWLDNQLKFTGTTIWRTLLPLPAIKDLDERFLTTGWWHSPTTHVYFSPVGEGLWEIAARAWQDPAIHSAHKKSWGVPVANEEVERHFQEYLPDIREALRRVPEGGWREFAAFAGPELETLTAWEDKIVLVGDASHALSGAFGSGAGFAMEDGWILANALELYGNDTRRALQLFNQIRLPYYSRMYAHLASEAKRRAIRLEAISEPSYDDRVKNKNVRDGGQDMQWIYGNDIGKVWEEAVANLI